MKQAVFSLDSNSPKRDDLRPRRPAATLQKVPAPPRHTTEVPLFRWVFTLLVCLMALCGTVSAAEPYPSRPIRLVLGVGTGGVGDITMRLAAQHMSRNMGQQIVVDNRPSAGGVAAAMAVVNANPDDDFRHRQMEGRDRACQHSATMTVVVSL